MMTYSDTVKAVEAIITTAGGGPRATPSDRSYAIQAAWPAIKAVCAAVWQSYCQPAPETAPACWATPAGEPVSECIWQSDRSLWKSYTRLSWAPTPATRLSDTTTAPATVPILVYWTISDDCPWDWQEELARWLGKIRWAEETAARLTGKRRESLWLELWP